MISHGIAGSQQEKAYPAMHTIALMPITVPLSHCTSRRSEGKERALHLINCPEELSVHCSTPGELADLTRTRGRQQRIRMEHEANDLEFVASSIFSISPNAMVHCCSSSSGFCIPGGA